MEETWVQSLGWEDPLEEGKATLSGILAWKIPWDRKHGEVQGIAELDTTEHKHTHNHDHTWDAIASQDSSTSSLIS